MKYSLIFTLTVLACVIGHGLVLSFNLDISQAVGQIRKSIAVKAAEPHLYDAAQRLAPAYVRQFQQARDAPRRVSNSERQSSLFSSLLLHGVPMDAMVQRPSENSKKLSDPFKWVSCGSPHQIMEILSLTVKPDPVSFPGQISFSFNIEFHDTISSSENVTVALDVYIKSSGEWFKVPCLGVIGSCTYVDFCQLIAENTCPQNFTDQGVPCKCPFNKGKYMLNDFAVQVDAEVLMPGDYKAKVQVSSDKKGKIACYEVYVTAA